MEKLSVWLTVVLGASATVATIAAVVTTVQVSAVSDLAGNVRDTNARTDGVFKELLILTKDMGSIRTSLETTTVELSNISEQFGKIVDRLDENTKSQKELAASVRGLSDDVRTGSERLESIEEKIDDLAFAGDPKKLAAFWGDAFVALPTGLSEGAVQAVIASGADVQFVDYGMLPVGWSQVGTEVDPAVAEMFAKIGANLWIGTTDDASADVLRKIIAETKKGEND